MIRRKWSAASGFRAHCAALAAVVLISAGVVAAESPIPGRVPNTPDVAIARDYFAGKITSQERALYRAFAAFEPEALPDRYKAALPAGRQKCLTAPVLDIIRDWDNLPERGRSVVPRYIHPRLDPTKTLVRKGTLPLHSMQVRTLGKTELVIDNPDIPPYDRTYPTTNFLIHWSSTGVHALVQNQDSDSDGVPDMIEYVEEFLEATWNWAIANGYRLPPGTEGPDGNYYNIYFGSIPALGFCETIDGGRHSRSFIVLLNDFSGFDRIDGTPLSPADEMRVTASHEFFHAVQFAYDAGEDRWWMESTAIWIEDVIGPEWDAVNDYAWWVWAFLDNPEISLDAAYDYNHNYMDVLWPIYLQSHLDPDGSIIREIWEACDSGMDAVSANDYVISRYDAGGILKVFGDFLVANYEQDYPEAPEYPMAYGNLHLTASHYSYPTGLQAPMGRFPQGLGANYVRFVPVAATTSDLNVTFGAVDYPSGWLGVLVGKCTWGEYQRTDFASGGSARLGGYNVFFSESVLIVSPQRSGYAFQEEFGYTYSAQLLLGDQNPPTPNPPQWSVPPQAASSASVTMTAVEGIDASPPVMYRFMETTGAYGGSGTTWQESPTFTDAGLAPNTQYAYRFQMRDSSPARKATAWSEILYACTLCNTPIAPSLYDPSPTKLYITVSASDGNPSSSEYAVYNETTGQYVGQDGMPSAAPCYQERSLWTDRRVLGLSPGTEYAFRVSAKNNAGVTTGLGPSATMSTLVADTLAPLVTAAYTVPTWVKEGLDTSAHVIVTGSDRTTGGSDIVAGEYYFDTDPGEGSGVAGVPVGGSGNPVQDFSFAVNTASWTIAHGPYDFHARIKDETGHWSAPYQFPISAVDATAPAKVTDLQAQAMPAGLEEDLRITAASASSEDPAHPAADAVDSDTLTYWATAPQGSSASEELTLDLDSPSLLSGITLVGSDRLDLFPAWFRVKVSDGVTWWTVVSQHDYTASAAESTWQFTPVAASRVKLVIEADPLDPSAGTYVQLAEVRLQKYVGGQRAVQLSWTAPSDTGPMGRASSYVVRFTDDPAAAPQFGGTTLQDIPPAPGNSGTPESMVGSGLEPGRTCYFVLKSADEYLNYSQVSNVATAATLPDDSVCLILDEPADQSSLDLFDPPAFVWRARALDTFKVQFSNVPSFPTRPYKDALGRPAKTLTIPVGRGNSFLTPTLSQWKAARALAGAMDGTLYWRIQATSSGNKALGTRYSEVYHEYGFSHGLYTYLFFGPAHSKGGVLALWPNAIPQFLWTVDVPTYGSYYIDFSSLPDINVYDKKHTLSILSKNYDRTWYKPTLAEWKSLKKKLAGVNGGLVYWRVRGIDPERAFAAASDTVPMVIDSPAFDLRQPAPRRDGTVMPGEVFTLDWTIDGEGYPYFEVQVSTSELFPKGPQTIRLKKVLTTACDLTPSDVRKIQSLCTKAATDTFYWRVVATDLDKTMSAASEGQAVKISVEPAQPGV